MTFKMGVLILLFLLQMGMLKTVLISCLVSLSVFRLSGSDFVEDRERVVVIDSYVCLKTTVDRTARVSEHLYINTDSLQTIFNIISEIMGEEKMSAMYEQLKINLNGELERIRDESDRVHVEERKILIFLGIICLGLLAIVAIIMVRIIRYKTVKLGSSVKNNIRRNERNDRKFFKLKKLVCDNDKRVDQLESLSVEIGTRVDELTGSVKTMYNLVKVVAGNLELE